MKKRFMAVLLALVMCLGLAAPAFAAEPEFEIAPDGVLTAYNGPGGDVVIPAGVTAIGESAFSHCDGVTSVTIPDGVTRIGDYAFAYCGDLASVTIPDSVTRFGRSVFRDCTALASVPEGVTALTDGMFAGCTGLTEIVIPEGVERIGVAAFVNCSGLVSVTIPNSVTVIEQGAFAHCISLREIVIPEGVTEIGHGAFYNCPSLAHAVIPSSVTEISGDTFYGCYALADVTIPDSVTQIGAGAFNGTPWLEGQGGVYKGVLLSYQGKDRDAVIPEGVVEIGTRAFYEHPVTSITFPESVTRLAYHSVVMCKELTGVKLPSGLRQIDDYAIVGCTSLTAIYIPPSVTQIGTEAFLCTEVIEEKEYGTLTYYVPGGLTIYGEAGSYAETYAKENGIPFLAGKAPAFADVRPNAFYLDAVDWAVEKHITTGTTAGAFSPGKTCTHSEILTFLWRAAGEPESGAQPPTGMNGNEFYYKAALWAAEKGMIGAGFNPKAPCTRADAVTYIWRALGRPDAPTPPEGVIPAFTDVTAATHPADRLIAVSWAVCAGVTRGTGDGSIFSPNLICTRGEIVTFLYRAYK